MSSKQDSVFASTVKCKCLDHIVRFSEAAMLVAPLWKVPWRGFVSSGSSRRCFPLPTSICRRSLNTNSHAFLGVGKFNGGRRCRQHGTCHIGIFCGDPLLISPRCACLGQDLGSHLFSSGCFRSGQGRDWFRGGEEGEGSRSVVSECIIVEHSVLKIPTLPEKISTSSPNLLTIWY